MQGWYRAQVVDIYPDTEEVDLKFLDYGGYARTDSCVLKQIRTDFMSLPFQATECYLSNIAPLAGKWDKNIIFPSSHPELNTLTCSSACKYV